MGIWKKLKNVKKLSALVSMATKDYDNMPEDKKAEMYKMLHEYGYEQAAVEKLGCVFADKVKEDINKK